MILDTSFLIDLFDGREGAFEKGVELSESKTAQRVPAQVVMELSYGVEFGDEISTKPIRWLQQSQIFTTNRSSPTMSETSGCLTSTSRRTETWIECAT